MASLRHDLRADEGFLLRSPLLPFTTLVEWGARREPAAARRFLAALLERPEVEEALYVASPRLHDALAAWRAAPGSAAGQRVEHALVKYVARMTGRSTPFGLFAGVSTGRLGRQTSLVLAAGCEYRRRTRLDNDYVFALGEALAAAEPLRGQIVVRPNTSLYQASGRWRYAAVRLHGRTRHYHLVSVESTPYLEATLRRAAEGARPGELASALAAPPITIEHALAYVFRLIEAQLLVPELGVNLTGLEPIDAMIAQLESAGADEPRAALDAVRAALAALDADGIGNRPARYRAIATMLEPLPAPVDPSLLFQIDLVKPAAATLGTRVVADVASAVAALARISQPPRRAGLDEFRRAFTARWDRREIPLADALDEECGIGFEPARGPGSEGSPLLDSIEFPAPPAEPSIAWGPAQQHMMLRFTRALVAGHEEIELTEADVEAMAQGTPVQLPDAFSTLIRLAGTAEQQARGELDVLLAAMAGPSGAKLIGRFCHASPEIDAMVRAHHATEEAGRPDAIFAEIVHLDEGRTGNIACRPVLRAYELVFLGMSGAPHERQILLDDLLVSVRGGRIVLRSRRLGREVIPRLSTAHDPRWGRLGAYRFLCAVAGEGTAAPAWAWGPLARAPYLPRVRLGRVVLARQTWNLDASDLAGITAAVRGRASSLDAVSALRSSRRLPRYLALAGGDTELPIDLDNPLLAAAFADEVAGLTAVTLREMFPAPDRLVVHGPEGRFTNELVITFTRSGQRRPAAAPMPAPTACRSFGPASEWLDAKLYCGESGADRVLRDAIAPLVNEAMQRGELTHWFFVRNADPDPHVRVRFSGDPSRLLSALLPALRHAIAPLVQVGAVRKLVLDTYERELERYGGDRGIEIIERIFWRDSEAVLGIVELLDGDAGTDARWRLALRGIESLLGAIGLDVRERAQVAARARARLGDEHRVDAAFSRQLGAKFAEQRASLESLFIADPVRDSSHELAPGFELLRARDAAIAELAVELGRRDDAGELTPRLAEFAWSLAHMHANRLLHASQRAQELVLYDFLQRLHASRAARRRS